MEKITETNFIRQILSTEVKYVIGIGMFVFGVARPYYEIKENIALVQKDISVINSNHEVHIQDILQELKDQKQEIQDLDKQIILISSKR